MPNPIIAGVTACTIDGAAYDVVSDAKYMVNTIARETQDALTRITGYKEKPVAGYISVTLRDRGDLAVADFNAMTDVSVMLSLKNGKTVYGDGLWQAGDIEVDSAEATLTVKFEGPAVYESTL